MQRKIHQPLLAKLPGGARLIDYLAYTDPPLFFFFTTVGGPLWCYCYWISLTTVKTDVSRIKLSLSKELHHRYPVAAATLMTLQDIAISCNLLDLDGESSNIKITSYHFVLRSFQWRI